MVKICLECSLPIESVSARQKTSLPRQLRVDDKMAVRLGTRGRPPDPINLEDHVHRGENWGRFECDWRIYEENHKHFRTERRDI